MGKYGGKVLTVYITPSGVRIAEGENKNGSPVLSRFFIVSGVEEYFTEIPADPGSYEITNMAGLVYSIVNECHNQHTTCKRVMVASNCFGIYTKVESEGAKGSLKDAITGDLSSLFKKREKGGHEVLSPDKMSCKITWGTLVEDGAVSNKKTVSVGDKFILKSLVQEFYKHGYDVISIADSIGTLINFRHTEEATFDSQGKIVFDFDTNLHVLTMKKDLPMEVSKYPPMTEDEILERLENLIVSCLDVVGRNPKVYLTGSLMCNTYLYNAIIDRLQTIGYLVYDLFDRPEVDPTTGRHPTTGAPVLTGDYSVNIAMFMSAYAKNIVTILPTIEFSEIFKKNSKAIATVVLVLSVASLGVSAFFAGGRFLEMRDISGAPSSTETLQTQIQNLQSNKASLNATIETLTKADVTVLDLMNFVSANQSNFVTIVSVDTMDMLPGGTVVTETIPTVTQEGETPEETITGTEGGPGTTRQPIVLRGYARSGPAAVAYFDKLFKSGLPVDPTLNGIQVFELPNKEDVYIFEIQIGGVV